MKKVLTSITLKDYLARKIIINTKSKLEYKYVQNNSKEEMQKIRQVMKVKNRIINKNKISKQTKLHSNLKKSLIQQKS